VFGFSTENWIRPRAEVRHILGLHEKLFGRIRELNELNVRIGWIGRPFDTPDARTPKYVQKALDLVYAGHITASFFVNSEEPLANLLEVMRHLMSHNGHLKTAIVP